MSDFIQVVKGEDKVIKVVLKKSDGTPYSLSGVTAQSMSFQNADNSTLTKSATITSSDAGTLQCTLSDTETALLKEGKRQAFYVTLDKGTDKEIILTGLEMALSVVAKPF
jgi:hypothetical protein